MDFTNIIPSFQDPNSFIVLTLLGAVLFFVLFHIYKHRINLITAFVWIVFTVYNVTVFQTHTGWDTFTNIVEVPVAGLILTIFTILSLHKTFKGQPFKIFMTISAMAVVTLLYSIILL